MNGAQLKRLLTREDYVRLFRNLGYRFYEEEAIDGWIGGLYRDTGDKNPGFNINIDRGLAKDFGSSFSGDIIDLIMHRTGRTFPETIAYILENLIDNIDMSNPEDYLPLEEVVAANDLLLSKDNSVLRYLTGRGLTPETLRTYRIGVVIRSHVPWVLIPYAYNTTHVTAYKMMAFDREENTWMRSEKGRIMKTVGTGKLFPMHRLQRQAIYLCEGEFDAMILRQMGYNALTGTVGAGTFKPEWVRTIKDYTDTVYIAYDADESGAKGARKAARALQLATRMVDLPEGLDVNDLYLRDKDHLVHLLTHARSYNPPRPKKQTKKQPNVIRMLEIVDFSWERIPAEEREASVKTIARILSKEGYGLTKLF